MNRRRELTQLLSLLDESLVLGRLKMIESSWASGIHHHAVELSLRILTVQSNRLVFEIFWIFAKFVWYLLSSCCALVVVVIGATFFAFSAHNSGQLDFFMFKYMCKNHSCHVGVICGFVIVREQSLTFIIAAMIFRVEFDSQISLELVVVDAFFVHLA